MYIDLLLEEKKDGFISTGLELILLLKEKKKLQSTQCPNYNLTIASAIPHKKKTKEEGRKIKKSWAQICMCFAVLFLKTRLLDY